MEEKKFDFEFDLTHYYQFFDNFKEKQIGILQNFLGGDPILYETISFNSYAHISFDDNDKKRKHPYITIIDKVGRGKCNCLIYDVKTNEWNNNFYDKLFIYKGDVRKYETYGYVFYNTKTGDVSHIFEIEQGNDLLVQRLKRNIFSMVWKNYSHIYARKGGKKNVTEKQIQELIKTYGKPHCL